MISKNLGKNEKTLRRPLQTFQDFRTGRSKLFHHFLSFGISNSGKTRLQRSRSNNSSDHVPSHTIQHHGGHTLPRCLIIILACGVILSYACTLSTAAEKNVPLRTWEPFQIQESFTARLTCLPFPCPRSSKYFIVRDGFNPLKPARSAFTWQIPPVGAINNAHEGAHRHCLASITMLPNVKKSGTASRLLQIARFTVV